MYLKIHCLDVCCCFFAISSMVSLYTFTLKRCEYPEVTCLFQIILRLQHLRIQLRQHRLQLDEMVYLYLTHIDQFGLSV